MRERGLALHPDLVLVGFYIGNDIDGSAARARFWPEVDRDGLPLRVVHREMHVEDNRWVKNERSLRYRIPVLKNSHLAQLLYDAGKRVVKSSKPLKKQLKKYRIYETVYEQKTEENVERVKKLFIGMARLARAHDIAFAAVMIPTREQVYPQRYQDIVDIDLEKPQRIFSEFFANQGIGSPRSSADHARGRAGDRPLYYQHDSHWRSAGQALAVREISDFLLREGLVPDGS